MPPRDFFVSADFARVADAFYVSADFAALSNFGSADRSIGLDPLWRADAPEQLATTLKVWRPAFNGTRAKRVGKRYAEGGDVAGREMGGELRKNMREYTILSNS